MPGEPNAAAIERKARPIYDLLNKQDYKGALKQSNQALGKHPHHPLFLILKAYAYERLHQLDETFKIVDEIAAIGTDDDEVLQLVTTLLKTHHKPEKLLHVYARSAANHPNDLGLQQELFLCHVRLDHVLAQQQIAVKLNKAVPTELHLFWVVCSMLTQAARRAAGDASIPLAPTQLLKMAGALAQKQLAKEGLSYDALLVFLDVLQAQQQFADALAAVEGPTGAAVQLPQERLRLRAQLNMALGRLDVAAQLLKQGLTTINADDWAGYLLYFDCLLPTTAHPFRDAADGVIGLEGGFGNLADAFRSPDWWRERGGAADEARLGQLLAEAEATVSELVDQVEEGASKGSRDVVRAPFLARVEVLFRKLQLGLCAQSDLAAGVLRYFQRYRSKPMTHLDLQLYVGALRDESRGWLAAALQEALEGTIGRCSGETGGEWTLSDVRLCMNALQLRRYMGLPELHSEAEAVAHALACARLFAAWGPVMAEQAPRDLAIGEDVAAMAADAFVAAHHFGGLKHLVKAIVLLHVAASHRSCSAAIQFALSALYGLLGAADRSLKAFNALEIRQVQLDTLSHHVVPFLVALGEPSLVQTHVRSMLAVRTSLAHSVGDMLAECYVNARFGKVLEFGLFKRREGESLTYLEATTEGALAAVRAASAQPSPPADKGAKDATKRQMGGDVLKAAEEARLAVPLSAASLAAIQSCSINDDLLQRPAWFPPPTDCSALAVMEWWGLGGKERAAAGRSGPSPWWHVPEAAMSGQGVAERWRSLRLKSVHMRAFYPTLLAGCLLLPNAPDITDAMSAFLAAGDLTWAEVDAWWRQHAWHYEGVAEPPRDSAAAAASSHAPLLDCFRFLPVASFALGAAMQSAAQLLQPTNKGHYVPLDELALRSARSLEAVLPDRAAMAVNVCTSTGVRVARSLACDPALPLLNGGVLSSLLVLVEHEFATIVACLESWHAALAGASIKKSVADGPAELHTLHDKVLEAMRLVTRGLLQACSTLADALSGHRLLQGTAEAIGQAVVDVVLTDDLCDVLQAGDAVKEPVMNVVHAQRMCLERAQTASSALILRLTRLRLD